MASTIMNRILDETRKHVTWVQPAEPAQRDAARTLRQWEALESLGLVRLTAEPDSDWEPDCECGSAECMASPEYDGDDAEAFGSVGEFRMPLMEDCRPSDSQWRPADSVWGHVGYRDVLDWRENPYILDVMRGTIDAFRDAWKRRVRNG